MKIRKMTYAEKLTSSTCIFCGAPLQLHSDRCNYCNCHYISTETYEEIKSSFNFMSFNVIDQEISEEMDTVDLIPGRRIITKPTGFVERKISITLEYSDKAYETCKEWFNTYTKQDVSFNLKDYYDSKIILFEGAMINSIQVQDYNSKDLKIVLNLHADKLSYKGM